MTLTLTGALAPCARICDIGATQLFGDSAIDGARSFLTFYSQRTPAATHPDNVGRDRLEQIANGGFLGDLLLLAGFEYRALDIFHGTNTILFDLNVHAPGPKLFGQFDLVTNFGTTEHVFNQLRAFQTIHDLTRVGGVVYHDLPMAGYFDHAFFRYDPLFFRTLIAANGYESLFQAVSVGAERMTPSELKQQGYEPDRYVDMGIEIILRRTGPGSFLIPLETSTSLSVDPAFKTQVLSEFVTVPAGTTVSYGTSPPVRRILTRIGRWLRGRLSKVASNRYK